MCPKSVRRFYLHELLTQLVLQDRLAGPHGAWKLLKFLALMALPLEWTSAG